MKKSKKKVAKASSNNKKGNSMAKKEKQAKLFSPEAFKAARQAENLSQAALAKRLKRSTNAVIHWETGKSFPHAKNLAVVEAFIAEVKKEAGAKKEPAKEAPPAIKEAARAAHEAAVSTDLTVSTKAKTAPQKTVEPTADEDFNLLLSITHKLKNKTLSKEIEILALQDRINQLRQ
jgi:DNA-binding transcriptional regulator YiaG